MYQEFDDNFLNFSDEMLEPEEILEIMVLNLELMVKTVALVFEYSHYTELKSKEINILQYQGFLSNKEKSYIQLIYDQWHFKNSLDAQFLADLQYKIENSKRYLRCRKANLILFQLSA